MSYRHDAAMQRLRNIINSDRGELPPRLLQILQSELYAVLNNYLDCSQEDIKADLTKEDGRYTLTVTAEARGVKTFKQI